MEKFELIYDYRDNKHYNVELLNLMKREGAKSTFEDWMVRYQWDDNYVPFALVNHKGDIVANVGVMKMSVFVGNTRYKGIQLISLLVRDSYKNQDVESILLNMIVNKFENVVDAIYSFDEDINEFLQDFPHFDKIEEFIYSKKWDPEKASSGVIVKKMDLSNSKEFDLLYHEIKHTTRVSPIIATSGDVSIKLFNILKYYDRNVYHVPSKDAFVIFTNIDNIFRIVSIYSKSQCDLQDLLNVLVPKGTKKVEFGFIPGPIFSDLDIEPNIEGNKRNKIFLRDISAGVDKSKIFFPTLSRGR
ncbi:hypothetical protein [Williamsoniiplasma luminosum]|uniref:GNAT family N-acetyltransferase n=1 Tax=Williamsoniiplasma luminosum TaxID=214888 RepID=A0A2S0NKU0_9MOLU|nr:hypothetical protein [Williamsoniiplasma luminosum]AVP49643.1 MAG: hypothetical protein C5T88_03655 [Williamsoniiplasma luminosum]